MKYVFDSRDIAEKNPPDRRERPVARGGAVPFSRAGDTPGAQGTSWIKSSGLRALVMVCVLGVVLYFFFREAFLYCFGKWLLVAVFMPLVAETIIGLLRNNSMHHVAPQERDVRRRRWSVMAWCLQLLACIVLCGAVYMVFRRSSANAETPRRMEVEGKQVQSCGKVKVTAEQVKSYLTPSDAEVEQLYRLVVNAPFVVENLQYGSRLKDIPFIYIATNDVVNAAAERGVVEKDGKKGLAFHTVFLGGAARYARLVGLAAALQDAGHENMLRKFVAAMPKRFCGLCDEESCLKFIAANGLDEALADEKVRQRAMSYSSGTIVSVIAHECGHHALGHLLGFPEKKNLEIDQNQEREADSFASSVISASSFGEYIFAGTLFWHYAIAMQSDGDSDAGRSHPLSRERFENFVRSNAEKAAAMGITLE